MMLHVLQGVRKRILPLIWLNFAVLSPRPKLSAGETTRPLSRFLFIFGVLRLQIRQGWIRWKANTPSYNFYGRLSPNFVVLEPKSPLERR
jgi:hypothetical protein